MGKQRAYLTAVRSPAGRPRLRDVDAGRRLKAHQHRVLELWEQRARQRLTAARRLDAPRLRNSLPEFLEQLILKLSPDRTADQREEEALTREHGERRSEDLAYELPQVIEEYQLLRQVIFEVLEQEGALRENDRDTILDAIDAAIRNSSEEFMQRRERIDSEASRLRWSVSENLRLVVEGVRDHAIIQTDALGRVVSWNIGAERIFGWSREEVVGQSASMIFSAEERARRVDQEEMRLAVATGKAEDKRWHVTKQGSRIFANGTLNPLRDESGQLIGFVKVLRDETERKLGEERMREINERLRESEARTRADIQEQKRLQQRLREASQVAEAARKELQEVFRQAPVPFAVLSGPEHRFTLANPLHERFVNRQVIGKTLREVYTEAEASHIQPVIERVYRTGDPSVWKELPIQLPDSSGALHEHYLNVTFTALRDLRGAINAVSCLGIDVTEEVKARKAIEESEARFRQIADAMPQIVWTATPEGLVDWYNEWWFSYTGYPRGTVWDDPVKRPMHPEDVARTWPRWQESLETGEPFEMEQRFRRGSDGEYRWHLVRGVPVRDPEGRIIKWVGGNVDIHEQKKLLQRLEEERELRERFVAALSHDLRTPITAAKMNAQMLPRKATTPELVQKMASRIVDNMDRADQMIRNLLDVSRISAGEKLSLQFEPFDLTQVARDTIEELSAIHGDRFRLRSAPKIEGYWSGQGLRRILENLVSNAVKYGAAHRPITIALSREGERVVIEVHNEGNPIPSEDQRALFVPYSRTASAMSGGQKGWGLGLTLVRGIAEAHGGAVTVESAPAAGTTFRVALPLDARSRP